MKSEDIKQCLKYSSAKNRIIKGVHYPEREDARRLFEEIEVKIKRIGERVGFPFDKKGTAPHFVYSITIHRADDRKTPPFKFYGSAHDFENDTDITPYDVLTSVSCDFFAPNNFNDFCAEFGYDEDSRSALRIFRAVQVQKARLRMVFNEHEVRLLPQ
jgi:hypothetical protein